MKSYKVTLILEDSKEYVCEVQSSDDFNAVEDALKVFENNGINCNNYVLKQLERLT
jgi:hypothetical protein